MAEGESYREARRSIFGRLVSDLWAWDADGIESALANRPVRGGLSGFVVGCAEGAFGVLAAAG